MSANSGGTAKIGTDWRVRARQPVGYDVRVLTGLLSPSNSALADACGTAPGRSPRCLLIVDDSVDVLHGDRLRAYFEAWSIDVKWHVVPGGEQSKNLDEVVAITEAMTGMGILRRSEKVVAVGGGAVLDVAGMAAGLYRRGVPYVRVPTTLIGQVDAGIGVKTGINHGTHKNRLGSYYAPEVALIDPEFLRTVPKRHIANGLAEIVKMALIKDAALFDLLELAVHDLDAAAFADGEPGGPAVEIMSRAIGGMLDELEPNLWEEVLERSVDYGHTFSPSLELRADPPLLHGEAVAVDMAVCVALAHNRGMLGTADADRAIGLLRAAGLPVTDPVFTTDLLVEALRDAVKHRDGEQRIPLTDGIGSATFVHDITREELGEALRFVRERAGSDTVLVRAAR
ncbi:sedoheptulose 7-phosphate cyclase [Saccharopolyspora gregorii]|uniref:sedoheptulose 7-phosphate cyclase n=1 Tax=Saccharopolyspora gregorii TaxID=33914 RepID=UPI0021AC977D|nr:sedoheptulose 7-phosphate cyclase [Saccharopolyspora gregorii]